MPPTTQRSVEERRRRAAIATGVVLLVIVIVFVAQNSNPVEIRFFLWTLTMPLVIVLVATAVISAVIAELLRLVVAREHRDRAERERAAKRHQKRG